jgi:CRP/FNR family transcriptional regulator, cyclic AMP receptor protein
VLRAEHALSDRFIAYMLNRNIRIEEDLLDQLFDSTEKGLARNLLLRASYGTSDKPERVLPKLPPAALAKMVGTTPERISAVLEKFTRLGFIEERPAGLAISTSLLSVVLHD